MGMPEAQEGPCDLLFDGLDISQIYEWCEVYGDGCEFCTGYTGIVDDITSELTNLNYDYQTDQFYMCVLTVESQWGGADPAIYIEAEDQSGGVGQMLPEYWTFNPPLTVSLTTNDGMPLDFGEMMLDQAPTCVSEPHCTRHGFVDEDQTDRWCPDYVCYEPGEKLCDIQFSTNQLVLKNTGSIVELWPYIAATNFYSSNTMAKCPFTNELDANQFEYSATQGTWDSGWRIMPQYAPDLGCDGPGLNSQCRGGCRITTGCPMNTLYPGNQIAIKLKVVWPTPCIGTFDVGSFYTIVRAV
jgi:hypothetical protein